MREWEWEFEVRERGSEGRRLPLLLWLAAVLQLLDVAALAALYVLL